jgi:TetR/AcrR family transcriptional repressor of nem operon
MGRHKEFSREAVLDRAIEAFWSRGYEATSVQDLVDEMGINRGSLYDTFGDKHALFLAAIDRYHERTLRCTLGYLEAPIPAREAIEAAVRNIVSCAGADEKRRGCFVTNSAVELAPHCAATTERVAAYYLRLEEAFYDALFRAERDGEIRPGRHLRSMARFITCCLQGMLVMSKVADDPTALDDVVDVIISTLG